MRHDLTTVKGIQDHLIEKWEEIHGFSVDSWEELESILKTRARFARCMGDPPETPIIRFLREAQISVAEGGLSMMEHVAAWSNLPTVQYTITDDAVEFAFVVPTESDRPRSRDLERMMAEIQKPGTTHHRH